MRKRFLLCLLCLCLCAPLCLCACQKEAVEDSVSDDEIASFEDKKAAQGPTIYIAADTTAVSYQTMEGQSDNRQGWGYYLDKYFDETVTIKNLASGTDSARSYVKTEYYSRVFGNIEKDDYLLIQFGHVDSGDDATRYTSPRIPKSAVDEEGKNENAKYSFEWFICEKYIKPAQAIGAFPVLLSPTVKLHSNGPTQYGHEEYIKVLQRISEEMQVPYIDVADLSMQAFMKLYTENGYDTEGGVARMYAWRETVDETADTSKVSYSSVLLSYEGAYAVAGIVAQGLHTVAPALDKWLLETPVARVD